MRVEEIAELDSLYQQLLKLNDDIKAEKVLNENYCGVAGEFLHILRGKRDLWGNVDNRCSFAIDQAIGEAERCILDGHPANGFIRIYLYRIRQGLEMTLEHWSFEIKSLAEVVDYVEAINDVSLEEFLQVIGLDFEIWKVLLEGTFVLVNKEEEIRIRRAARILRHLWKSLAPGDLKDWLDSRPEELLGETPRKVLYQGEKLEVMEKIAIRMRAMGFA